MTAEDSDYTIHIKRERIPSENEGHGCDIYRISRVHCGFLDELYFATEFSDVAFAVCSLLDPRTYKRKPTVFRLDIDAEILGSRHFGIGQVTVLETLVMNTNTILWMRSNK